MKIQLYIQRYEGNCYEIVSEDTKNLRLYEYKTAKASDFIKYTEKNLEKVAGWETLY